MPEAIQPLDLIGIPRQNNIPKPQRLTTPLSTGEDLNFPLAPVELSGRAFILPTPQTVQALAA